MQETRSKDTQLKQYCDKIVTCLVIYGGLHEDDARTLLDQSELCDTDNLDDQSYRDMLLHEMPYYWAMGLLYGPQGPRVRQDDWWQDSALWPPPNELADPDWPNNVLHHRDQQPLAL